MIRHDNSQTTVNLLSFAAAAMAALAVVVPSGYSIGAVLLLSVSSAVLVRSGLPEMGYLAWATVIAMLAYSIYWIASAALHGADAAAFDQSSRSLLAVPVLIATAKYGLRWSIIWPGIACGGLATGFVGVYEAYFEMKPRASGFVGPEHFGNLSVFFATMSIVGFAWAIATHQAFIYRLLLLTGAVGGIAGSVASGTRASWIALLVIIAILVILMWQFRPRVVSVAIAVSLVLGFSLVVTQSHTSVVHRVQTSFSDIANIASDDVRHGSISTRFDAWRGAAKLFSERPVFGWGDEGYQREMAKLGEKGYLSTGAARLNHAHNDWLNTAAKRGILGVIILAGVYFLPATIFYCMLRSNISADNKIVAFGGLMMCVNFFIYGLAHHALGSNNGVMTFSFWCALFCGFCIKEADKRSTQGWCFEMPLREKAFTLWK